MHKHALVDILKILQNIASMNQSLQYVINLSKLTAPCKSYGLGYSNTSRLHHRCLRSHLKTGHLRRYFP